MNPFFSARTTLSLFALALVSSAHAAVVFTNNGSIGFNDTTLEGSDIIASNCVLTIDGTHTFARLQVLNGAVLTHSASTNGLLENRLHVSAELHVLVSTNGDDLNYTNVDNSSIVVRDQTATIIYTNSLDYLISSDSNSVTAIERTDNSTIPDGATVLVDYDHLGATVAAGLNLNITSNLLVAAGGAIRVDGQGYGSGTGPGHGWPVGSGAGHGGFGGLNSVAAAPASYYGSFQQPTLLGSGGGDSLAGFGGAGGGKILIVAGDTIQIEGKVSANGASATNARAVVVQVVAFGFLRR